MRYLFVMPTNWGHETMILMFAIFYCAAAGYCHYYRAHVRVDVIYASRSPRTKAILDIITSVFFFTFVGVFTYTSWNFYWSSQTMRRGQSFRRSDSPARFPLPTGGHRITQSSS